MTGRQFRAGLHGPAWAGSSLPAWLLIAFRIQQEGALQRLPEHGEAAGTPRRRIGTRALSYLAGHRGEGSSCARALQAAEGNGGGGALEASRRGLESRALLETINACAVFFRRAGPT